MNLFPNHFRCCLHTFVVAVGRLEYHVTIILKFQQRNVAAHLKHNTTLDNWISPFIYSDEVVYNIYKYV